MLKHTPLKRLGEPTDMANAALFLCSPAAAWVSDYAPSMGAALAYYTMFSIAPLLPGERLAPIECSLPEPDALPDRALRLPPQ